VTAAERGKPVISPADCVLASDSQEKPKGRRVREEGVSESRFVMSRIGVEPAGNITPLRKQANFPLVLAYVNHGQTDLRKPSRCRLSVTLLLVQLPTVPLLAPTQ
jgi:hypothetical protein